MRVYSTDNGWGLFRDESGDGGYQPRKYRRTYTWNSRNQLVSSVDANYSTSYVYGQDGQRSNKYTQGSETLYFNKMWTLHTDNGNSVYGGQYAKNVYLGETRIVTKLARADQKTAHEEMYKQYYYHSDHLGSASMISDWEGKEYQRIEYTPYGETWVEKTNNSGSEFLPYKFTGKEVDQETGLYYYGARYLDPKYSMWISTDPALGEYVPEMGKGNAKDSGSLPGMGGVYNHINFHLYHYAGNNPVRFVDPDGRQTISVLPVTFDEIPLDKIGIGVGFLVTNPQIIPLVLSGLFILCLTGDSTSSKNINYYETDDHQSEEAGQLLKKSTACVTPSPLPPDPDDQPNFKNSKDTAKVFKTDAKNFERNIKQNILKDVRAESSSNKELGKFLKQNSNPDIGTTKNGEIWLKSRTTGEIVNTGLNVLMYLE